MLVGIIAVCRLDFSVVVVALVANWKTGVYKLALDVVVEEEEEDEEMKKEAANANAVPMGTVFSVGDGGAAAELVVDFPVVVDEVCRGLNANPGFAELELGAAAADDDATARGFKETEFLDQFPICVELLFSPPLPTSPFSGGRSP